MTKHPHEVRPYPGLAVVLGVLALGCLPWLALWLVLEALE